MVSRSVTYHISSNYTWFAPAPLTNNTVTQNQNNLFQTCHILHQCGRVITRNKLPINYFINQYSMCPAVYNVTVILNQVSLDARLSKCLPPNWCGHDLDLENLISSSLSVVCICVSFGSNCYSGSRAIKFTIFQWPLLPDLDLRPHDLANVIGVKWTLLVSNCDEFRWNTSMHSGDIKVEKRTHRFTHRQTHYHVLMNRKRTARQSEKYIASIVDSLIVEGNDVMNVTK